MLGGAYMNSEYIKNHDPLQLQQMIIFLKAELAKYKQEAQKYKDSYHYSLVERFTEENEQLLHENKMLMEKLHKVSEAFDKQSIKYHELEAKNKEHIATINSLQTTKIDLQTINTQLTEVIYQLKNKPTPPPSKNRKHDKQIAALHSKIGHYQTTIEKLESRLIQLLQEVHQQWLTQVEMTSHERNQYETRQQQLVQEIEEKNTMIDNLQHELVNVKRQQIDITPAIDELDQQIAKLLAQSIAYEQQLNAKSLVLNTLEQQVDQLTLDINPLTASPIKNGAKKEPESS